MPTKTVVLPARQGGGDYKSEPEPLFNMLLRHSRRLVRYTGDSSTVAKFLSTKGGRVSVAELSEMSLEDQMSERKSSTQGQRSEGRIAGIKVQVKPFN